jgi:hypothetical protein
VGAGEIWDGGLHVGVSLDELFHLLVFDDGVPAYARKLLLEKGCGAKTPDGAFVWK